MWFAGALTERSTRFVIVCVLLFAGLLYAFR